MVERAQKYLQPGVEGWAGAGGAFNADAAEEEHDSYAQTFRVIVSRSYIAWNLLVAKLNVEIWSWKGLFSKLYQMVKQVYSLSLKIFPPF